MVLGTKHLQYQNPKTVSSILLLHIPLPRPLPTTSADVDDPSGPSTETSSLLSVPGDIVDVDDAASKKSAHSHYIDVTGLALLYKPDFWQLWVLLGLLTGVGLMTIK